VSELRAMRDSTLADIGPATDGDSACAPESVVAEPMLVSNTTLKDFRMILSQAMPVNGIVALPEAEQQLLHCRSGDTVRTLTLNPRKNNG
jgi:arginine N-succinyltransferase